MVEHPGVEDMMTKEHLIETSKFEDGPALSRREIIAALKELEALGLVTRVGQHWMISDVQATSPKGPGR
jgi:hypothetical protein